MPLAVCRLNLHTITTLSLGNLWGLAQSRISREPFLFLALTWLSCFGAQDAACLEIPRGHTHVPCTI